MSYKVLLHPKAAESLRRLNPSFKGEGQRPVKGAGRVARREGTAPQITTFLQDKNREIIEGYTRLIERKVRS